MWDLHQRCRDSFGPQLVLVMNEPSKKPENREKALAMIETLGGVDEAKKFLDYVASYGLHWIPPGPGRRKWTSIDTNLLLHDQAVAKYLDESEGGMRFTKKGERSYRTNDGEWTEGRDCGDPYAGGLGWD